MRLQLEGVRFAYNSSQPVLQGVNLEASSGEITALIGPNASGKSTLLKCIAGILRPEGNILLDGRKTSEFKKKDITRYISYLPQDSSSRALMTVFEAVLLGRLQSLSWRVSDDDLSITAKVMDDIGIEDLASRFLDELSGGQKQMVSIAQALVREPRVLLLDEPTSNLDLRHKLEILDLVRDIASKNGITTIIALHDLSLSARYADRLVVLQDGNVYSSGAPEDVLTQGMIRSVYEVNAKVSTDEEILQITPIGSIGWRKG
ncbi:MAG: ABC transporter ATP-binding protein [Chloroflexota bacterium]|nr:ABC transporter ATP-binding protein [Chloroflexota bacterium]